MLDLFRVLYFLLIILESILLLFVSEHLAFRFNLKAFSYVYFFSYVNEKVWPISKSSFVSLAQDATLTLLANENPSQTNKARPNKLESLRHFFLFLHQNKNQIIYVKKEEEKNRGTSRDNRKELIRCHSRGYECTHTCVYYDAAG